MAPEQIRGAAVDGRADLFSLAVILYEALSGRRPFDGEDLTRLAYAIVHEHPIPITRLVPGLPPALDRFFDRALAKEPERRFPDGAAFRTALREAWASSPAVTGAAVDSQATVVASPVSDGEKRDAGDARALAEALAGVARQAGRGACRGAAAGGRLTARGIALAAPRFRALISGLGRHAQAQVSGMNPRTRRLLLAGLLVAGLVGVSSLWLLTWRSSLVLDVKNSYESATLTVSVDGETVYARGLQAEKKKVKAFGKKLMAWGQQEFQTTLSLNPGQREILVQVVPDDESVTYEQRAKVNIEPGESHRLRITTGRKLRSPLTVKFD
jgi:hypothetical protein